MKEGLDKHRSIDLISYQNDGKSRAGITRKLGDMSEYSSSCIDMRAAEVLISACA